MGPGRYPFARDVLRRRRLCRAGCEPANRLGKVGIGAGRDPLALDPIESRSATMVRPVIEASAQIIIAGPEAVIVQSTYYLETY